MTFLGYHAEPDNPAVYVAQSSILVSERAFMAPPKPVIARKPPPEPIIPMTGTCSEKEK